MKYMEESTQHGIAQTSIAILQLSKIIYKKKLFLDIPTYCFM